jgi:hypothetical protein
LQFGQQANYVGTHYWNTQESYFTYGDEEQSPVDHDISFRAGLAADGSDTYTPRTVIYDLKGAFGTLRRENALYELQNPQDPTQLGSWAAGAIPLVLPSITQSPYQQALDSGVEPPSLTADTVRFWSDYNRVFYHPKSIVQLNEYEVNSSLMPFERWQTGEELFTGLDREHDLLDRDLRPFLEECDQLQGIQIMTSTDDAWGGFAAKYLERVADDLGKGCRWVFGFQDEQRMTRERKLLQAANVAQSLFALDSVASVHVPMGNIPSALPSHVNLGAHSRWETSALQSAAIETMTLPARLRSTQSAKAKLDDLEAVLNGNGQRRVAACAMTARQEALANGDDPRAPPHLVNGYAHDQAESDTEDLDIDFIPAPSQLFSTRRSPTPKPHMFSQIRIERGSQSEHTNQDEQDYETRRRRTDDFRDSSHPTTLGFPLISSFPGTFRSSTSSAHKVDIDVSITTSTRIAERIRAIEADARRLIGLDEREALCDGLAVMAEEYADGWSSDEDGDDDE